MNKIIIIFIILIPSITWSQNHTMSRFDSLLVRCNMEFKQPKQIEQIEKDYFRKIPHDVCFRDKKKGNYEIQLFFQPLDSTIKWYEKGMKENPKSERMKPNDFCKSMMMLAVLNASNNVKSDYQLPSFPETAKILYNADWQASALVEVIYSNYKFKYCLITCIHKDNIGDVYIYYLTNEKKYLLEITDVMTGSLKFK